MLTTLREYFKDRELKRQFGPLFNEIEENLESYYVMFQLNRLRFFKLEQRAIVASDWGKKHPAVSQCYQRLEAYNVALKNYKDFEEWYNADLEHKTAENGRILHEKKELAQAQFEGLEMVIKQALSVVQTFMKLTGKG